MSGSGRGWWRRSVVAGEADQIQLTSEYHQYLAGANDLVRWRQEAEVWVFRGAGCQNEDVEFGAQVESRKRLAVGLGGGVNFHDPIIFGQRKHVPDVRVGDAASRADGGIALGEDGLGRAQPAR